MSSGFIYTHMHTHTVFTRCQEHFNRYYNTPQRACSIPQKIKYKNLMCNIPSKQMTAYNFDVTVVQLVIETIQLMFQNDSQFPVSWF